MPNETPKTFIHTKDFYHWMRDASGNNTPTSFYWFSVIFYYPNVLAEILPKINQMSSYFTEKNKNQYEKTFYEKFDDNIQNLRYCIQKIELPKINYSGYSSDGKSGGNGTIDTSNMYGTYTILGNSYLGISQKTISMKILNTYSPIIEKFIYPWMLLCLQPSTPEYLKVPFLRIDMAIKFYKPNTIITGNNVFYFDMENVKPEFVYYVKGLFPSSIEIYNPIQDASGSTDNNRSVEFTFNQLVVLPNKEVADKFNQGNLFNNNNFLQDYEAVFLNSDEIYEENQRSSEMQTIQNMMPHEEFKDLSDVYSKRKNNEFIGTSLKNMASNALDAVLTNQLKKSFQEANKIKLDDIKIDTEALRKNLLSSLLKSKDETNSTNFDLNMLNVLKSSNKVDDLNINDLKINDLIKSNNNMNLKNNKVDFNIDNAIKSLKDLKTVKPDLTINDLVKTINQVGEVEDLNFSMKELAKSLTELKVTQPDLTIDDITVSLNDIKVSNPDLTINDLIKSIHEVSEINVENLTPNDIMKTIDKPVTIQPNLDIAEIPTPVSDFNSLFNEVNVQDLDTNKIPFSKIKMESDSISSNLTQLDVSKINVNSSQLTTLEENVERVRNQNEFDEIVETEDEGSEDRLENSKKTENNKDTKKDVNYVIPEKEDLIDQFLNTINSKINVSNNINAEENIENILNRIDEIKPTKSIDEKELLSPELIKSNKKLVYDKNELTGREPINSNRKEIFNKELNSTKPINSDEQKSINNDSKRKETLQETLNKIIDKAKSINRQSILIEGENRIVGIMEPKAPVNYSDFMVVKKGTKEDIMELYEKLKNNHSLNPETYKILNNYAKETNQDVKEVIKKYKAMNEKELNNFVISLTDNSIIHKDKIEKAAHNTDVLNDHLTPKNEIVSDIDLDGLFN